MSHKKTYILENLGCAHCASKMEEKIRELPSVNSATITYATQQLRLSAEDPEKLLPEIQAICSSIESQVRVIAQDIKPTSSAPNTSNVSLNRKFSEEQKDFFQILIGAIFLAIGMIMHKKGTAEILTFSIFVVAYFILGEKILLEACKNILNKNIFDENFLMSIATIGAFVIREYPEAVGVMLFFRIGEYFEHRAIKKSRSQIKEAIDLRPEIVNLIVEDEIQTIPAQEARIGDLLLIRPGDRIPLDGIITEGNSRLDTSAITGEAVPVTVKAGDSIFSGCVNTSGQLKIRVEKLLKDSMVSRILESVENAAASKPKIDRFITRFAKIYTPCVVTLALFTAIVPSLLTKNWSYWTYTAFSFLVMSCPCALVLSVPLAFFSGIGVASKQGILFKGGLSIEALHRVKAVVMDKTGTITQGEFKLQKIISCGTFTENELLRLCASCEQHSSHPIAHSIITAAHEKNLYFTKPFSFEEIAGYGISASLTEGNILCGNQKLMEKNGIKITNIPKNSGNTENTEVFLALNGMLIGYLLIADTIKKEAPLAISRLKSFGLHTSMLTGDSMECAKAVASETGIEEVHAKLLPQDKLDILTQIRCKHGSVMFVGDGINDAPVLAGANVGAAMGSGADAAIEAADVVFMTSSVTSIPEAISIARSTNRIAIQNIVFALLIKIIVMILGLCGFANMWMAVFADSGVAMLCVLNSIRILYRK